MKFQLEEERDHEFLPKFKRRKVFVVRKFPIGCGPFANQMPTSKGEDDGNAVHVAPPRRNKFNLPNLERLKAFPVRRNFPTNCGNIVSTPSRNFSLHNLKMTEHCKRSKACVDSREDDAQIVASPFVMNKEVKEVVVKQMCEISYVLDNEVLKMREEVVNTLNLFQDIRTEFLHEMMLKSETKGQALCQVNFKVANALQKIGKCVNINERLGFVPGVEVGDRFQCRAELKVIGLHHDFYFGIHYMEIDGKILATSIVDSHRYDNVVKSSRVLIYSGEGGNPSIARKPLKDQKLVKGNLALKNSMEARTPVRVILSSKISKKSNVVGTGGMNIKRMMYVYDGLYIVGEHWKERGRFGNLVYKFKMIKINEQSPFDFGKFVNTTKGQTMHKGRVLINDISKGKEKFSICLKNDIDDEKLSSFNYVTKIPYPYSFAPSVYTCYNCIDGCTNSKVCVCAIKNGNVIPYDCLGCIVVDNPFVYECSPSCKCSHLCINKVSQNGIHFSLEVFKSKSGQWGVRPRYHISSGSFVCEYITGEVLQSIERKIDLESHMFKLGKEYGKNKYQGEHHSKALQFGNVGSFISHSCSPNLIARYIFYDHDDKQIPHIMLFAMKHIPPFQELTFDYSKVNNFMMYNGEMNMRNS